MVKKQIIFNWFSSELKIVFRSDHEESRTLVYSTKPFIIYVSPIKDVITTWFIIYKIQGIYIM